MMIHFIRAARFFNVSQWCGQLELELELALNYHQLVVIIQEFELVTR